MPYWLIFYQHWYKIDDKIPNYASRKILIFQHKFNAIGTNMSKRLKYGSIRRAMLLLLQLLAAIYLIQKLTQPIEEENQSYLFIRVKQKSLYGYTKVDNYE